MISLADLVQLAVGSITAFVGFAALAISLSRVRAGDRAPLWFGVFSMLYGVRLLVSLESVGLGIGLPELLARFIGDGITYAILAPACLLAASLSNSRSAWLLGLSRLDVAYAAIAIGADVARGSPGSMMWMNAPAVAVNFIVLLGIVATRVRAIRPTPGVVAALVGLAVFVVLATIETFGGRDPQGADVSLEPLGMLALVLGLGLWVAELGMANERRVVAVSQELATARRIQRSILPVEAPCVPGIGMAARLLPMTEVAGDFYDFLAADDVVGVLVADVPGHGVPAAIVASMVKIALASEAEHLRDPGLLLTRLNRALSGKSDIAFITAVYACVDVRERRLSYSCAGHPPPWLLRATGQVERLVVSELVLCVDTQAEYRSTTVQLHSGDCIVLHTDGLAEAQTPGGEFFGDERVGASLARIGGSEPAKLAESLIAEARAWCGGEHGKVTDDVTVIAMRID